MSAAVDAGSVSGMVRLKAIDHVQLAMPAGEESRAEEFYSGLLGLERQQKPEPMAARGGCWFSNGAVTVHLGVEQDFRPARRAHPAVVVEGFDEMVARLDGAGYATRPDNDLAGVRRCFVDDPFGNRVELIDAG